MNFKKKILYFYPHPSTFIMRDIEMLKDQYNVLGYEFKVKNKYLYFWEFFKQALFLIINFRGSTVAICHFAGYPSLLPTWYGKILKKSCFVIVAGTDASKFPTINYGNFNRKLLKWATSTSLKMAKVILPVHRSLVYQEYTYDNSGSPAQGYTFFAPSTSVVPFIEVNYGYDSTIFKPLPNLDRKKNSFITIGILSEKNVFLRKGMDLVIELAKLNSLYSFTIIGGNENENYNVPENVTILPILSTEELIALLSTHEFYLQLSLMEGFPNALAEAMLCGCIPIGSNVSGIPDIIGDCGYILEYKDLYALNKIVNDIQHEFNLNIKTNLARKRIIDLYSIENRKNKLVETIEKN